MKYFKKICTEMLIPVLFAWFMMTILVDIITVPTVFRNSSSLTDAGKIGMILFSRFNVIENIFAVVVFWGVFSLWKAKKTKFQLIPAVYLFVMSWVYTFYMTPKITETTYKIYQTKLEDPLYAVLQTEHAYYHNTYRTLDSIKLVVLLTFIIWALVNRFKQNKELT